MDAMVMESLSSKVRHDERTVFIKTCDSIGTTPSNAIRMFVSAFNRRGGFPFDPSNPYGFNQETLEAIENADQGQNLIGPFDTVEQLFESLDGE